MATRVLDCRLALLKRRERAADRVHTSARPSGPTHSQNSAPRPDNAPDPAGSHTHSPNTREGVSS